LEIIWTRGLSWAIYYKNIFYIVSFLISFYYFLSNSTSSKNYGFGIFFDTTLTWFIDIAFKGLLLFSFNCFNAIYGAFLGNTVDSFIGWGDKFV